MLSTSTRRLAKKPRMTAETNKRANEKRQATRKRLGILGKRQRAKLKRGG